MPTLAHSGVARFCGVQDVILHTKNSISWPYPVQYSGLRGEYCVTGEFNLLHKILSGHKNKDKMGGSCSMHGESKRTYKGESKN